MNPKTEKILIVSGIILLILVLGSTAGYFFLNKINQPQQNNNQAGGDKDEYGCIGSAGYTWCEAKNKCLRTWEEECDEKFFLCTSEEPCQDEPNIIIENEENKPNNWTEISYISSDNNDNFTFKVDPNYYEFVDLENIFEEQVFSKELAYKSSKNNLNLGHPGKDKPTSISIVKNINNETPGRWFEKNVLENKYYDYLVNRNGIEYYNSTNCLQSEYSCSRVYLWGGHWIAEFYIFQQNDYLIICFECPNSEYLKFAFNKNE